MCTLDIKLVSVVAGADDDKTPLEVGEPSDFGIITPTLISEEVVSICNMMICGRGPHLTYGYHY